MRLVRQLSLFITGLLFGAFGCFVYLHLDQPIDGEGETVLHAVMPFSEQRILPENQHCEGSKLTTAGDVLASLILASQRSGANRLVMGCDDGLCNISLSDCKPWQTSECNQRFLQFEQSETGEVDPLSFRCFDLP